MDKSRKKSAALCAGIFVVLGMWMILSVHCRAAEMNSDEKLPQAVEQKTNQHNKKQKNQKRRRQNRKLSVSVHLRIHSIMSIKTVSGEDMDMNSCRLWQVMPDGNLSM